MSVHFTSYQTQAAILSSITHPQILLASSSSFSETNTEYELLFETTKKITGLYLMPVITVLGILGNILIVIVYQKSQKYSTNIYLIVLSLSDILKLANDFLYFVVNVTNKIDTSLSEKIFNSLYLYSHYVFVFTSINTSWMTSTIAIDRFITVSNKRPKQTLSSYYKSIVISIFLLSLSALISIPSPLFLAPVDEFDANANKTVVKIAETHLNRSTFSKYYKYLMALARAFIPLLLLIYLNFLILRIVYKNKMKRREASSKSKSNRKSKSRVTLMLSTIISSFVICMFPDAIMTMMQFGYANEGFLIRTVREVTDLLLTINSAITFPICFHFSHEFQSKVKRLCCECDRNAKFLQSVSTSTKSSKSPHRTILTNPNVKNNSKIDFLKKENEQLFKMNQNEASPTLNFDVNNKKTEYSYVASFPVKV